MSNIFTIKDVLKKAKYSVRNIFPYNIIVSLYNPRKYNKAYIFSKYKRRISIPKINCLSR